MERLCTPSSQRSCRTARQWKDRKRRLRRPRTGPHSPISIGRAHHTRTTYAPPPARPSASPTRLPGTARIQCIDLPVRQRDVFLPVSKSNPSAPHVALERTRTRTWTADQTHTNSTYTVRLVDPVPPLSTAQQAPCRIPVLSVSSTVIMTTVDHTATRRQSVPSASSLNVSMNS